MSLIRDAKRLERLAQQLLNNKQHNGGEEEEEEGLAALEQAANFVVNFNMAGLYRIESQMFVEWLRDHLCDVDALGKKMIGGDGSDAKDLADAFRDVIDRVDRHRVQSEKMGKELVSKCSIEMCGALNCTLVHTSYQRL